MKTLYFIALFLFVFLRLDAQHLESFDLKQVSPKGWLYNMLEKQNKGFTSKLCNIIYPFNKGGWGTEPFIKRVKGLKTGNWIPYEQTAYYYDGMLRTGYLLNDEKLVKTALSSIYNSVKHASPEGVICPELNYGQRIRWPHAVYFRAWMAAYESEKDKNILDAMERHFLNDTVSMSGRDLCNIEAMSWLYLHTKNQKLFDKIKSMYFNPVKSIFKEEVINDFSKEERQDLHAVTYHELLKLPIIMYMLTENADFLDIARNGFNKLDRYSMLPDGVSSSEEGVSGKTSRAMHETCNVIDYMWTLTYMLRATKETEWADKIERALFNAGIGSITKEFDAHQYYSCPNQVYCDDYSSHNTSYGASRLAYRQFHQPPCCTGNINRMLPVYIGNMWMKGGSDELYKTLYGPGSINFKSENGEIVFEENSVYPYSDSIRINVISGTAKLKLYLRIPGWAKKTRIIFNGKELSDVRPATFYLLERLFKKGDEIIIIPEKSAEFRIWDEQSLIVDYGPILFALPVKAHIEKSSYQTNGKQEYYGYKMTPVSDWNYILGVDGKDNSILKVNKGKIDENDPWGQTEQALTINIPAYKDPTWKTHYLKNKDNNGNDFYSPITPPLPSRGAMIFVLRRLKPELIKLVPYGSTCLRMSMFPFHKETEVSPEALAAE